MRIVFLGTPEFALPSLKILHQERRGKFNVVAVVTSPDAPAKRKSKKIEPSPVKKYALKYNIPVLQPKNFNDEYFLQSLRSYKADLQVVVAFKMLPKKVWDMPRLGTINLHASLLPRYRGAAPINWAIINGEKETGVTTFFLDNKMDTGLIAFSEKEPIFNNDTFGSLSNRLMVKGAFLVQKTVNAMINGTCPKKSQSMTKGEEKACKFYRQDCEIDWNNTSKDIYNFVRGLNPTPGAWAMLNDKQYKIFEVRLTTWTDKLSDFTVGEIYSDNKNVVYVGTKDFPVSIIKLQPAGKKIMDITDFLKGNFINIDSK